MTLRIGIWVQNDIKPELVQREWQQIPRYEYTQDLN